MSQYESRALPKGWSGWRQNLFSIGAIRRHLVWVVAACASGFGAYMFNFAEEQSEEARRWMMGISPYLQAGILPIALVLICALRDKVFPGTDGTGIPQTIAALKISEGPERSRVLSLRIMLGKMLLLVMGLFAGPTIGREGPSVHVGACIMSLSSRFATFQTHLVERGLILAGGAAGIAAAFNTPIAGAVFAFEEIGRSFEKNNAGTIVRTAVVACLVNLIFLGDYYFYGEVEIGLGSIEEWMLVPVVGVLGGTLGGCFAQAVISANRSLHSFRTKHPHAFALTLGLGLGLLGLASAGLTYGSGYTAAKDILINGASYPVWLAPAIAAGNFITLLSGIPGGLFDPSLTTGAALGQITHPLFSALDPQTLILLWMVSYFGGVVQSPITAFVILIEMTHAHEMALPLAAASLIAYEMSHLVCRTSLYESLAESFLDSMRAKE